MGSKGVTEAPVVRPTMEEFCDFEGFLDSVHALGMAHGIVRVVPPKEWADMQPCLFKEGERCERDIDIPTPAQQNVSGQLGVYECLIIEKKKMKLKQFQEAADRALKQQGPRWAKAAAEGDSATIEAAFWKNIQYGEPPMYGADMVGSLFSPELPAWDLDKLDTILQKLLVEEKVTGVTQSYLYWGMARAFFAMHCEDMDLFSVNYLHGGAPKSWWAVPPDHADRVESFVSRSPSLPRSFPCPYPNGWAGGGAGARVDAGALAAVPGVPPPQDHHDRALAAAVGIHPRDPHRAADRGVRDHLPARLPLGLQPGLQLRGGCELRDGGLDPARHRRLLLQVPRRFRAGECSNGRLGL